MSPLLASFSWVSLLVAVATGGQPGTLSDKEIGEIKMKILDLRENISKLRQQEQALQKQLDEANKAATKAPEPYVKMEVKGTLKEVMPELWVIDAGGSKVIGGSRSWTLDFGTRKGLLELAKQHKGQIVVITGQLVLQDTRRTIAEEQVLVVATLKAVGQ